MKRRKRCAHCGRLYHPSPRVKKQRYCSADECQRERRNRAQRERRKWDKDHRGNDRDSRKRWAEKNPDYWKEYRKNRPKYTEKNRVRQRRRNQQRKKQLPVVVENQPAIVTLEGKVYEMRLNPLGDRRSARYQGFGGNDCKRCCDYDRTHWNEKEKPGISVTRN